MSLLIPIKQVGSQQVQQQPQNLYLRQTDPNFTQPLSSKFGGLDNRYYATSDLLFNDATQFIRLPVGSTGNILIADPSQRTGVRWSNQLTVAQQTASNYISKLPAIQTDLSTAQNDYGDVQAGIAQVQADKQQIIGTFTTLNLYVNNQKAQLTKIDELLDTTTTTVNTYVANTNNIYNNINELNTQINSQSTIKDGIDTTLNGYTTILTTTQSALNTLGVSNIGASNRLINGDFMVWQRGTSYSGANTVGYLTADRWFHSTNHGGILTSQKTTTTLPAYGLYNGSQVSNALKINVANNTSPFYLATAIEEHLQQTVTVSVWLMATTPTALALSLIQRSSTGTDNVLSASSFSVTTSWTQFSATFNTTSQANGLLTIIKLSGSTWSNVQVAKFQLQYGTQLLEFEERNIQLETMLCRRYYETGYDYFNGYGNAYSYINAFHAYTTEKRVVPTITQTVEMSSGFLNPVTIGAVNSTTMGSSMYQKNNRSDLGYFKVNWTADSEIAI